MQVSDEPFRTTDKKTRHTKEGHEVLNPVPMQPQLGAKPTLSLAEQMRQQIMVTKKLAELDVAETEEEADDFEIDEDPAPVSPWENDMIPSIKESRAVLRRLEEQERRYADAEAAQARAREIPDPRAKKPAGSPAAGEEEA